MTIAQAINDIAAAHGGTPAKPVTIAGAIDALNDALAGSDQQAARTIEDAVVLLGEHIGGGGGGGDLGPFKPLAGADALDLVIARDDALTDIIGEFGALNTKTTTQLMYTIPAGCYFGVTANYAVMELVISTQTPVGPMTKEKTASYSSMLTGTSISLDVYKMPETDDRFYAYTASV